MNSISNNLLLALKYSKKTTILFLIITLFLNIFFETFSIGLLIPFLNSITNNNFYEILYNFRLFDIFSLRVLLDFFQIKNNDQLVIFLSIIFVLFFIMRVLMNFFTTWYIGRFKFKLHLLLSEKMLKGYLQMPYQLHLKKSSVKTINNITSEVDLLSNNALLLVTSINEIILTISIMGLLIFLQPFIAINIIFYFSIVGLIFLFLTNNYITKIGYRRQHEAQQTNQNILEIFNLIKEIKIFNKQSFFHKKFYFSFTPSLLCIFFEVVVNSNLYFSLGLANLKHSLAASAAS